MTSISKNNFICLNRGDTFLRPLYINKGSKMCPSRFNISKYPGTEIYLGIMEPNQPFEKAIIRKIYTSQSNTTEQGDLLIEIKSTDTEYLLPGKYYYEIKAQLSNGSICTVVPKTDFIIME